jgi:hypothetical protein
LICSDYLVDESSQSFELHHQTIFGFSISLYNIDFTMFFTKISLAAITALAAVSEARHHEYGLLHPKRSLSTTAPVAPTVTVYPIPLSTGIASAPVSSASATDLTLTYTLGTGTSTQVVTTTIHRTETDTLYVTATAVCFS